MDDTSAIPPPPQKPRTKQRPADSDIGRIVGGIVSEVGPNEVVLNLDDGRPGVIHRRDFDQDESDPTTVLSPGDRVEGAILSRQDPRNRIVLSRAWALKKSTWEQLQTTADDGGVISATVTASAKQGVVVEARAGVAGVRGFVPSSHLELETPTDLGSYVGQSLELKILEIDQVKERLVLSRRAILMKEQRKASRDLLASLETGEVRSGTVASFVDYGAFVDIGGIMGLVHLSEMSWSRVSKPSQQLTIGQEIQVKVLNVKVKRKRVSLSIRQLAPDPLAAIPVGEILLGEVSRLVEFGAFVNLDGVEGLVHLSELAEHRVFAAEEIVTPGEEVRVKVLSVDKKRRRVELSIRQAAFG